MSSYTTRPTPLLQGSNLDQEAQHQSPVTPVQMARALVKLLIAKDTVTDALIFVPDKGRRSAIRDAMNSGVEGLIDVIREGTK